MTSSFQPLALVEGSPFNLGELAPILLIAGFLGLVCLGALMIGFIYRAARANLKGPASVGLEMGGWRPDRPAWEPLFDAPFRWLAIRGNDSHRIQSALQLRNPRPCSWEEGLHRALEHKLFISPPVNGWILVMGADLPDPADDPDETFHFISRLSKQLGEVQFFSTNRLFSHHSWVIADQGVVRRGYAWAGQTVWNQGVPTQAELSLRMTTYDYCQSPQRGFLSYSDPLGATTEKVTALAARWSVDPTTVDFRRLRGSRGISGKFTFRASNH